MAKRMPCRVNVSTLFVTYCGVRREQVSFRKGRNTKEQNIVLRNIVEQAVEWNSSLYLCFVNYENAFDSIQRHSLKDQE